VLRPLLRRRHSSAHLEAAGLYLDLGCWVRLEVQVPSGGLIGTPLEATIRYASPCGRRSAECCAVRPTCVRWW
jgi:hypothetical protein